MVRVSERWDFRVFDTRRLHDLPLVRCGASLGLGFGLLRHELGGVCVLGVGGFLGGFLGGSGGGGGLVDDWELRRITELCNFVLDLVGTGLDGHAGAMKGKGEEHLVAVQSMIRGGELELGQTEGVAQMKHAVHVRVGEVAEELGRLGAVSRRRHLEGLLVGPLRLRAGLELQQGVAARGGHGCRLGWMWSWRTLASLRGGCLSGDCTQGGSGAKHE
mmetsp:Transcript_14187/g.34398  ORF Transcript_14187/g.34398 Transcript_14187/m.34398 type:complete len:217 (-) Transcript_14187:76-726(-)